MHHTVITCNLV